MVTKEIKIYSRISLKNVKWFEAEFSKKDLEKVKYINYSYWNKLSGGSRLVRDAIKNIKKGITVYKQSNRQFIRLAEYIDQGEVFPEIILVKKKGTSEYKLLEGHVRLTSYLLAKNSPDKLRLIVGIT